MIGNSEGTSLTLFRAIFMAPPALGLGQGLGPSALARAPEFLVERAPVYDGWGEALRTVLKRQRFPAQSGSRGVFLSVPVTAFSRRGEFQSVSLALHTAGILLLVYLPAASRAKEVTLSAQTRDTEKIYYRLTVVDRLQICLALHRRERAPSPAKVIWSTRCRRWEAPSNTAP